MIYTHRTRKAMQLAYSMHHGQLDKSGVPYIFHPIAVAEAMETEEEVIVALLHDTIEDCGITREAIAADFSDEIADAVAAITKIENEPYDAYVAKVKANKLARRVKIADLTHNMNLTRLNTITDEDRKRVEKYRNTLAVLLEEQ